MVRKKFPGKPIKAHNKKLVSSFAYTETIITDIEEICLGINLFNRIFGADDQDIFFHGFTPHDYDTECVNKQTYVDRLKSRDQSEDFVSDSRINGSEQIVDGEHFGITEDSDKINIEIPKVKRMKHSGCIKKKKRKSQENKKLLRRLKKSYSKTTNILMNRNSYFKRRLINNEITRKQQYNFVLPSHSLHSSRVIKPNRRFIDSDKNNKYKTNAQSNIKMKSCAQLIKQEGKCDEDDLSIENVNENSNSARKRKSENSRSRVRDFKKESRVILREARLNIKSDPIKEGPFSTTYNLSSVKEGKPVHVIRHDKGSGYITCGICGCVRFYKYILQTRKFGVYSCEPCRRFILRMITISKEKRNMVLKCKGLSDIGKCVIPPINRRRFKQDFRGLSSTRCSACWLVLSLERYTMSASIRSRLICLLPANMRPAILSAVNKSDKFVTPKDSIGSSECGTIVQATSILNNNQNFLSDTKPVFINCEDEEKSYKPKINVSIGEGKSKPKVVVLRRGSSIYRKLMKNQQTEIDAVQKNTNSENFVRISQQGPRIKHVCRSASTVLGMSYGPDINTNNESNEKLKDNIKYPPDRSQSSNRLDNNTEKFLPQLCSNNRIRQASENQSTLTSASLDDNENFTRSYGARTLQEFSKESANESESENDERNKLISLDFWETYDPDEVCQTGFPLIATEPFDVITVCFLCGSAGLEKLIHCVCCCESYHWYCIENTLTIPTEDDLDKYRMTWICRKCKVCYKCGIGGSKPQISCQRCENSYHVNCLTQDELNTRLFKNDRPWVCPACLKCNSCSNGSVAVYVGNLPLCESCFKLRQKGNYCPLCQSCYEDDDYAIKMMECASCKYWIHAKCEGISFEKYQILSSLPDTIEFICRVCCKIPPPLWLTAVESELKAGYRYVLKSLIKDKSVYNALKSNYRSSVEECRCHKNGGSNDRSTSGKCSSNNAIATDFENNLVNDDDLYKKYEKYVLEVDDESNSQQGYDERSGSSDSASIHVVNEYGDVTSILQHGMNEISDAYCNKDNNRIISSSNDNVFDDEYRINNERKKICRQCNSSRGNADDSDGKEEKSTEQQQQQQHCLFSIKTNEFSSLLEFHQGVTSAFSKSVADKESYNLILKRYYKILKKNFPWFNPNEELERDDRSHFDYDDITNVVTVCDNNNFSADETAENSALVFKNSVNATENELTNLRNLIKQDGLYYIDNSSSSSRSSTSSASSSSLEETLIDSRQCIFCRSHGDLEPSERGRLLYCGKNEWVHCNCALWSSEVFEEIDGSLQNVHSAISRGRQIRCSKCDKRGASIGCCSKNCPLTFHFHCARQLNCLFMEDKTFYCSTHHRPKETQCVMLTNDFSVLRPVYVEMDRKKKKTARCTDVELMIGSLNIRNLGKFDEHLSDDIKYIIPIDFECTRLFWSTVRPWKIVRYRITINVSYYDNRSSAPIEEDNNYTLDHTKEIQKRKKKAVSSNIRTYSAEETRTYFVDGNSADLLSSDTKEPQSGIGNAVATDLLPPDLKEALFEDLTNDDFIDDAAFRDFWSNYDKERDSLECLLQKEIERFDDYSKEDDSAVTITKYKQKKKTNKNRPPLSSDKKNNKNRDNKANLENNNNDNTNNNNNNNNNSSRYNKIEMEKINSLFGDFDYIDKSCFKLITQLDGVIDDSSECQSVCSTESIYSYSSSNRSSYPSFNAAAAGGNTDDEPVKCIQCHRTYRTTFSYERHLQTCNTDFTEYMMSASESESSVSSDDDKFIVVEEEDVVDSKAVITNNKCDNTETNKTADVDCSKVDYIENSINSCDNEYSFPIESIIISDCRPTYEEKEIISINADGSSFVNYRSVNDFDVRMLNIDNGIVQHKPMLEEVITLNAISSNIPSNYIIQQVTPPPPPKQELIVGMAASNFGLHANSVFVQQPNIIEQQPPTYIVNASPQQPINLFASSHNPVVSGAAATVILTSHPPPPPPPPPPQIMFGVETVVCNTVMSSSQFVAQSGENLGQSSMYSTMTTQVLQAAKPIIPAPNLQSTAGFIVINPITEQNVANHTALQQTPNLNTQLRQNHLLPSSQSRRYQQVPFTNNLVVTETYNNGTIVKNNFLNNSKPERSKVIIKQLKNPQRRTKTKVTRAVNNILSAPPAATSNFCLSNNKIVQSDVNRYKINCDDIVNINIASTEEKNVSSSVRVDEPANCKITTPAIVNNNNCNNDNASSKKSPNIVLSLNNKENIASIASSFNDYCSSTNDDKEPIIMNENKSAIEKNIANLVQPTEISGASVFPNSSSTSCNLSSINECSFANSIDKSVVKESNKNILNVTDGAIILPTMEDKKNIISNGSVTHNNNSALSLSSLSSSSISSSSAVESKRNNSNSHHVESEPPKSAFQSYEPSKSTPSSSSFTVCKNYASSKPSPKIVNSYLTSQILNSASGKSLEKKLKSKVKIHEFPRSTDETALSASSNKEDRKKNSLAKVFDAVSDSNDVIKNHRSATTGTDSKISSSSSNYQPSSNSENGKIFSKVSKLASANGDNISASNNCSSCEEPKTKWRTATVSFEVTGEDGFTYKTSSLLDLWNKIFDAVQESRASQNLPLLPRNNVNSESVFGLLGLDNNATKYLLEQLPDVWKCIFYKPVYHKNNNTGELTSVNALAINKTGCARTEGYNSYYKYDMFGWLASRHRKPPKFLSVSDSDVINGNRRITSLNLPMAMRFRHLRETAKETVGVFRSDIHGRGLFCLRDIDAGEMVIEYAGEVIRSVLTDKREKYYTAKGIGCYMFRIDEKFVVDATMCGNAARFINHSCEPNCYSRIVDILGKKHILIFAMKRIPKGEELTYDYKFPLEDEKISCHCLSRKCRKYLN